MKDGEKIYFCVYYDYYNAKEVERRVTQEKRENRDSKEYFTAKV